VATILIVFAILVAGATVIGIGLGQAAQRQAVGTTGGTQDNGAIPTPGSTTTAPTPTGTADSSSIAAAVDPAVVDVTTVLGFQNGQAAGTGIVLKESGIVLTNNHVVAGSTSITVTEVTDGRSYPATVIGYDRSEDIAVLQMTGASGLPTASLANSSTVKVGDPVTAIGNAGGTGGTPAVADGTVTALDRSITATDEATGSSEQLTGLIQVAADIQAGDSGGPLVNSSAQVIGIDTAASAGYSYRASGGQGFAIPINSAVTIANQILSGQASSVVHIGATAFLGVSAATANAQTSAGATVSGVVPGSPAEAAGLAAGDVIVSVGGQPVDSPTTLTTLLDKHHPGDQVKVGWQDSAGKSHTATVKLATGPVG
jgi:S1-C subfamily serine protease